MRRVCRHNILPRQDQASLPHHSATTPPTQTRHSHSRLLPNKQTTLITRGSVGRHCRKVRNVCNLLIVSSSIHSIVHVSCHRVLPSCHEWIASLPACLGGLVHTRVFFIYVLNSDYSFTHWSMSSSYYLLYFFVVECSLYFFCVSYGNI